MAKPEVQHQHELDAPPWQRVEATLMFAARSMRTTYDARLAATGLNLSQASSLAYVAEFGPISQTELAQSMGIGRAATGTVIDGLESLGYVERQTNPDDRRVWLVAITPPGRSVADDVMVLDETLRSELRAGISPAERGQLASLLVRLHENLRAAQPPSTNGDQ